MKIKKMLVLAGLVVAAAAFAAPASASASIWRHGAEPLEEHVALGLSGGIVLESESGVMLCPVHATLTTEGGSSGQITEFAVSGEGCLEGGVYKECAIAGTEALGLPWGVDVEAASLTITGADIERTFSGCGLESARFSIPQIALTTETPGAISEFEFIGEGDVQLEPGEEEEARTFGSFTVDGENAGTYGIG